LSAAAGFGFDHNKFGVFSTFSAFLEMTLSELTMARLNHCNLLCHFSHSGVDEMADNTCHFGIGGMLFDNGLMDAPSYMYFPADPAQMRKVVERVFFDMGTRAIFSTRAKVPWILKENSEERFFDNSDYVFTPGKDEIVRGVTDPSSVVGWVVTMGELL
jgi:transketolase